MIKYLVTGGSACFVQGMLELTEAQAKTRLANLKKAGEGFYEIINPVQFKTGEVVGFDGEPSRAMQAVLEPEQPIEKPNKPKK